MLLLVLIAVGALTGVMWTSWKGSRAANKDCEWMDKALLTYLFPALFVLTGTHFVPVIGNLKVMAIMAAAVCCTFILAKRIGKGLSTQAATRNGFIVLAVCANTGHGLMLLKTSTSDPAILQLAASAFYVGFLVVIFLPQLLVSDGKTAAKGAVKMVLWHPVSYGTLTGFALAVDYRLAFAYLGLLGIRVVVAKYRPNIQMADWKPWLLIATVALLHSLAKDVSLYQAVTKYYPAAMTTFTAVTIGIKMKANPMERKHLGFVAWVMVFGLVIAPTIALSIAWVTGCNYAEAYVLAYMLSQPPAYLGILWLRQGKFGTLSVSEWAFALQAVGAYLLAAFFPNIVALWF